MSDVKTNVYSKNILSIYSLKLIGEKLPDSTKVPTLSISVRNNKIYMTVWTNLPNDKDSGKIEAELEPISFYNIVSAIKAFAENKNSETFTFKFDKYKFINGKRSTEPMPDIKMIVDRDDQGGLFIAVISWDTTRPKIKFYFRNPNYMHLINKDGSSLSMNHITNHYALSWTNLISSLVPQLLISNYVEPTPPGQKNNGNSTTGYEKVKKEFTDDDLDF